ncbi:MAG: glycosyltransferase [Candidatus Absconditabacteria bacterium]|nr:glycosyltransferase [Candidatus Absconditabacteria bacterium]
MTIHRILGPKNYKNEGIWKYSEIYIEGLRQEGVKIEEYYIPYHSTSFLRFFYQLIILPTKVFINKKKGDKIIFYEEFYTILSRFFKKNTYIIVHHIEKDILKQDGKTLLKKIFIRIYLKSLKNLNKIEGIITVSQFSKNAIKDIGIKEDKIHVVFNSYDEESFYPIENKESVKERFFKEFSISEKKSTKIITHVSVFHNRKNFITILKSLKEIKDEYLCIKVGNILDKEDFERCEDYIKKNKLHVKIIESLGDHDLNNVLNISDIFVFSSTFEGFGRPPILAQACGCPVISTHGGALKEVLGNSCVVIKDIYSEKEFGNAINTLLNNNDLFKKYRKLGFENCEKYCKRKNIEILKNLLK